MSAASNGVQDESVSLRSLTARQSDRFGAFRSPGLAVLRVRRASAFVGLIALLAACGGPEVRRFPLADPIWIDPDESALEEPPDEYFSGFVWDAVDQTFFEPTSRYLSLDVPRAAPNVNAFDEAPDSSWFTNRLSLYDMSIEELRQGSCPDDRLDIESTWTVVAAKPNGANPGFIIRDEDGRGWLLKFDGFNEGVRATTADVFGSRVYHAAGYYSPCNVVVFFDPDILEIGEGAETQDAVGNDIPMEQHHIQEVLEAGFVQDDGLYRASASLFLPGRPLGPWTYQGRRRDDPNDVFPHQDRRELRGAGVLAAWLNHFDAREQNTLSIWAEEDDGRGFVRHYYLDFGDCLGSQWAQDGLSRRFGFSNYLDISHVAADFLTLGFITRPWETVSISSVAPIIGYYDAEHFEPENYRAGYPNPAFSAMLDEDAAWMARIIARMDEDAVATMLEEGFMHDQQEETELLRTIMARRQRVLDYYLRVRSPLADFEVQEDGTTLCFQDLATLTGVTSTSEIHYESRGWFGDFESPAWHRLDNPEGPVDPERVCVSLAGPDGERPADTGPPESAGRYVVIDLHLVPEPGMDEAIPPARLHFYDLGDDGFRLVGVERPGDAGSPAE